MAEPYPSLNGVPSQSHFTLYTLHFTMSLYTLHFTQRQLMGTLSWHIYHFALYTLHLRSVKSKMALTLLLAWYFTLYTLHSEPLLANLLYTLHFTLYTFQGDPNGKTQDKERNEREMRTGPQQDEDRSNRSNRHRGLKISAT